VTELDRASLDRILPSTPGSADWDDVLGRFRAARGRRRRRVAALAAAGVLVAAGTASAFGTVRDFVLDRGFVGLPPQGATPSAPESGELVLSLYGRSTTHIRQGEDPDGVGQPIDPLTRVWVYADGRMNWDREGRVPHR
jgi:hypothetical protein